VAQRVEMGYVGRFELVLVLARWCYYCWRWSSGAVYVMVVLVVHRVEWAMELMMACCGMTRETVVVV